MPVLSYVHHLFNVAQCHAYIHTLRWKDRPHSIGFSGKQMASSREHISTLDFPLRHDNTAARLAIEQPQQFQRVEFYH
jgi:hypothetical protein